MKLKNLFLLSMMVFLTGGMLNAQNEDEMMKAWMEMMTPGENHKMLANMEGKWTYKNTFWMMPGAEPQVSEGETDYQMTLGGRYLKGHHKGEMMMGMEFEGMSIVAYDNTTGKYLNTWMDNMGTGIMVFEGSMEGEKMVMKSEYNNPMNKRKEMHKTVTYWKDDNHYDMEYWIKPEGGEAYKSMLMEYTRRPTR